MPESNTRNGIAWGVQIEYISSLVFLSSTRHEKEFHQDLPMENTYIPCFYMLRIYGEKLEVGSWKMEESGF